MEKDWEEAPGKVMLDDYKNLLVPGIMDGNIFITVQAPRGYGMDPAKIYHDPYVAPTHQYISFYQWIRDEWKADAVIHVGTHGNLFPERERGWIGKVIPICHWGTCLIFILTI